MTDKHTKIGLSNYDKRMEEIEKAYPLPEVPIDPEIKTFVAETLANTQILHPGIDWEAKYKQLLTDHKNSIADIQLKYNKLLHEKEEWEGIYTALKTDTEGILKEACDSIEEWKAKYGTLEQEFIALENKYQNLEESYQTLEKSWNRNNETLGKAQDWETKYHALNEDFTNYSEQVAIKLTHLEAQNMTFRGLIIKMLVEAQADE